MVPRHDSLTRTLRCGRWQKDGAKTAKRRFSNFRSPYFWGTKQRVEVLSRRLRLPVEGARNLLDAESIDAEPSAVYARDSGNFAATLHHAHGSLALAPQVGHARTSTLPMWSSTLLA